MAALGYSGCLLLFEYLMLLLVEHSVIGKRVWLEGSVESS